MFYCRCSIYLGFCNLFHMHKYQSYVKKLSFKNNNICNIKTLRRGGFSKMNKKRGMIMHQYGSTMGFSKTPRIITSLCPLRTIMCPRPVVPSRIGHIGYNVLNKRWIKNLVKDVENCLFIYLKKLIKKEFKYNKLFLDLKEIKEIVPDELRICGSVFHQMIVIGDSKFSGQCKVHFDNKDIIACILTIGNPLSGGSTNYFDGIAPSNKGNLICKIPFQHGRLQICLYGEILHSVSNWFGRRITINFNVKDEIYQFFKNKSKTISYKQSKEGNFKSIVFL